ncbi:hypothetical protein [Paraburkholderia sp. C35]|uniref:hypothetical protein n=1 Tax=Paraburkholderia sp. C35 TaxID=2126993 RepID=UPI000D69DBD0|nr:hypothetical protein [Paraburkholderia sp. C35]
MADSAEPTISPPARARSQKRRTSTVSPETENKLARAARSAQRLAQLSDAARDGTTLDLFPDDTARAEQQAMNIDVRQGTLQGFELPDVVLAAVGAPDGVGFAASPAEAKAGARHGRGAASRDLAGAAVHDDGQMLIDTDVAEPALPVAQRFAGDETAIVSADSEAIAVDAAKLAQDGPTSAASLAAASVVRSVAAVRQTAPEADIDVADNPEDLNSPFPASTAPGPAPATDSADKPGTPDSTTHRANTAASTAQLYMPRATPELDHARATAFADTVDALYGVIADQRRAADDHTRRMKWMLTIVVCALLATIAIGIAQTLLLFRLSHQSTAHEQRIEQMMLNQQATLATLLDTDSSTTSLPVSAQIPVAPAPAAPAARPAETHTAHAQHAHKRKSAHTH